MKILKNVFTLCLLSVILLSCGSSGTINQAPVVEDGIITFESNGEPNQSIGNIEAYDPDGDVLSYELESQNPSGAVSLSFETGALTVLNADVFESGIEVEVNVVVSDGALSTPGSFIIIDIEDEE